MYMFFFLDEHDLDDNFAVVNVDSFLDVHVGIFHGVLESPYGEACVVGRDVSGDLMARIVELGGELRVSKNDKHLDSKISEVHLHDNMTILFHFLYCSMQAVKMNIILYSTLVPYHLHFVQI